MTVLKGRDIEWICCLTFNHEKYIEDALAEEIVNSKLEEGDSISMDYNEKKDTLTIHHK